MRLEVTRYAQNYMTSIDQSRRVCSTAYPVVVWMLDRKILTRVCLLRLMRPESVSETYETTYIEDLYIATAHQPYKCIHILSFFRVIAMSDSAKLRMKVQK